MGIIIKNVNVIDVMKGTVENSKNILIEKDRIKDIFDDFNGYDLSNHKVYDYSGKYLIPGIVNLHQHYIYKRTFGALWSQFKLPIPVLTVRALKNAMAEFKQGITTTRILGSVHNIDYSLKYLFKHKYVIGPRLFISGQPLVATGSHAATLSQCVDGLDEFRKWTRERVQYVDWVKTFASFDPIEPLDESNEYARPEISKEEMQVICEEAHNAGKKVAVHAIGTKAIRNSIEAGVDTIEHGVYLNEELALLMKEKGISLVPTLTAFTETLDPDYKRGERWIQLHAPFVEPNQKGLEIAHKVGVHIGMGLDSLGDLGKEVKLMQEITGLNGIEIIKICTYNGAKILGIEKDLGSIEIGKIADMVILNENPVDNITNIESTHTVIKEGDVYPVDEITLNTNYESEQYNSLIPELLK